jgi:hypothetical protein
MFDFFGVSVQNQQPRAVAARGWLLRDQLRRQIKMEINGSHGAERSGAGRAAAIHIPSRL